MFCRAIIDKSPVGSDVEPYTIVIGNPAKMLRKRFDDEMIDLLLRFKWWDKSIEEIDNLIPILTCSNLEIIRKELKKMDRHVSSLILGWIRKNLEGCENPRFIGKALTGDKAGAWRYRVGDYRIICEIHDEDIIILVLSVGHRREIYRGV